MKLSTDDIEYLDLMVKENLKRWEQLQANYDPITGEGVAELLGAKYVKCCIPDFAIKEMWVPEAFMKVRLIKRILRAGGIQKFIDTHNWRGNRPTFKRVVNQIRKIRHKYDYCNWAYECIHIDAKLGGRMRFKLNYAQIQVLKLCLKLMAAGKPINIIIDKARQWGGSTFCIFFQFWIAVHWDRYHSFAVAAHVQDAAHNVLNMLVDAIAEYPAWDLGLPEGTALHLGNVGGNKHAFQIKDKNNDAVMPFKIFIGSAERPESLRSGRISGAHYTEVGVWPNTPGKSAEDLVADISGGIPKQQKLSMQVFESTAKTSDDYFHDLCYAAYDGKSNFEMLFIAFFLIPHDTLPVDDQLEFAKWLYTHREDSVAKDGWKMPGKYYWWLWEQGACFESINWYRYEEKNFTKRSQMVNEAPASMPESFQSSGQKVFDFYDVDRFMHKTREPIIEGDLISDGHVGEEVIQNIRFISKEGGNLKIYEYPDDTPINDRYLVTVDIGGPNETSDYSSVRVFDRLMMMDDFGLGGVPSIVAEMHYHTDHDLLAYDAMRLAKWYNTALLVIESNTLETKEKKRETIGIDGFEYIMDIVAGIYGFHNLYARHTKEENMSDSAERKWGFHTNVSTKPKIIDNMAICLRDNLWVEPSQVCCHEMSLYEEKDKKMNAPKGKHDDVLMATAIGLWVCYKEMAKPTWSRVERYAPANDIKSSSNAAVI